jgi:pilus biogenesis lipoprotein CpaD
LSPSDQRRFHIFLRDFIQRGRTAVTVESTLPHLAEAILLENGLHKNEIVLAPDTTIMAPNAVLSFTANKVIAPECGDWSSNSVFNPSNKPHSNFGCAYQRNIGSVVADPGDLIQSQPATGGAAERTDEKIRVHQSGTVLPRLLDGGGTAQ